MIIRLAFAGMLIAGGIADLAPATLRAAEPASPQKPEISAEASAALQRMGETLRAHEFSFEARTIRVQAGPNREPLHIFHTLDVTVKRPDRLLVVRNGDDGSSKLVYDGKTVFIYTTNGNKYASIPVPGTLDGMMKEAMGRLGVDFPLADFLSEVPGQGLLNAMTSGRVVNTVPIDGIPCLHILFGRELELWLEKNEQSLPRRLILTYRALPGEPNFIATMSKWDFSIHPTDAEFTFQPPPGAVQMALESPAAKGQPNATKAPGGAK